MICYCSFPLEGIHIVIQVYMLFGGVSRRFVGRKPSFPGSCPPYLGPGAGRHVLRPAAAAGGAWDAALRAPSAGPEAGEVAEEKWRRLAFLCCFFSQVFGTKVFGAGSHVLFVFVSPFLLAQVFGAGFPIYSLLFFFLVKGPPLLTSITKGVPSFPTATGSSYRGLVAF